MAIVYPEFAPITHCAGVLGLPFDRLVEAEREWRSGQSVEYEFLDVEGELPTQLERLLPLNGPKVRDLWVEAGNGCVFFDNFVNGTDPHPVAHLSRIHQCSGFLVASTPDTEFRYGQTRLDVYGPEAESRTGAVRVVCATNDGGRWSWDTSGTPLAFERVEFYEERRIRDRLPPWLLAEYCLALSIPVFEESFYGSRGLLITNMARQSMTSLRTESLGDRRAQLGLL